MNKNNLWSLRLGFSSKEASKIQEFGINGFLDKSFKSSFDKKLPEFIEDAPKTVAELREFRKLKDASEKEQKKAIKENISLSLELKTWWIDKMRNEEFPLREKMVCFWQNHFVVTTQKIKVGYWIYQHNMILRENAFGNFRELTRKMLKTNAVVRYLDNNDNKNGKINENLSRELLELFTIGIGNYSENDIKNGARALSGLSLGEESAVYRKRFEDDTEKTYFGKTGNFKADDLVDIIFEQEKTPYFITNKILKWFIYDNPTDEMVKYYGDFFRSVDFEIQPLLTKMFTEEFKKETSGTKIKDPLIFMTQLIDELNIEAINSRMIALFIQKQGMDLYNQVNVKGWSGGNSWLTTQLYLQRNNVADLLCNGRNINIKKLNNLQQEDDKPDVTIEKIKVKINFDKKDSNKKIIANLTDRLLFQVDESIQKDMEEVLKYDFDGNDSNAEFGVLRLFNYIVKTPEFQLI